MKHLTILSSSYPRLLSSYITNFLRNLLQQNYSECLTTTSASQKQTNSFQTPITTSSTVVDMIRPIFVVVAVLLCCLCRFTSAQLDCTFTNLNETQASLAINGTLQGAYCYQIFPTIGIGSEVQYINLTVSNYTLGDTIMAFYDLGPINQKQLGSLTGAYSGEVQVSSTTGTLWIIMQTKNLAAAPVTVNLRWQSSTTIGNIPSFGLFVGLILMLVVPFLVLLIVTLTIRRKEAQRVQQLMRDAEQGTDNPIGKKHRAALPKSKVVGNQLITMKPPPTKAEHVIMWLSIGITILFFVLLFTGAFKFSFHDIGL